MTNEMTILIGVTVVCGGSVLLFLVHSFRKAHAHADRFTATEVPQNGFFSFLRRDNRGIQRAPCDLPFELVDLSGHVITGSGRVINLSNTGACFVSRSTLSLGQTIAGRLRALNHDIIRISGRIVWIRSKGLTTTYGLRFH